MTERVHDLHISLNIPLNSYYNVLSNFDDTCSYLNDMQISRSSELEKNKAMLYEARNNLEEKKSRTESLDFKITNIMIDRDSMRMENSLLVNNETSIVIQLNDCMGSLLFFIIHQIFVKNNTVNFFLSLTLRDNELMRLHLIVRVRLLCMILYQMIHMIMVLLTMMIVWMMMTW